MKDEGVIVLTEPWWDLRVSEPVAEKTKQALAAQVLREVKLGHELFGMSIEVVAKCGHCDDVLVLAEDRWALVHLAWEKRVKPPWPTTQFFTSPGEAGNVAALHSE